MLFDVLIPRRRPDGVRRGSLSRSAPGLPVAVAAFMVACGGDSVGPRPGAEYRIEVIEGHGMSAPVGAGVPVRVRVTGQGGAPVAGVRVEFLPDPGHGVTWPAAVDTDALGQASTEWTLAVTAGEQRQRIVVEDAEDGVVLVTALPGPAAVLALVESELRLTAFRETVALEARAMDVHGNVRDGEPIDWTATDPDVAAVDAAGRVTAHARGVTRVVARLGELADTAVVEVDPQGVITITFDDGWKSAYTVAFPVLERHGLKANVAVVTGAVGWPAYLDLDQIDSLHAAGWSMVSHTVTHADLTTLSAAELEYELSESRAWLEAHGLFRAPVFVVPYHAWGARELAAVEAKYAAARGYTHNQFVPDSLVEWRPSDAFALTGHEAEFAPFTTEEGRQKTFALAARAVAEAEFLDIFFHDIRPEHAEDFERLIEALAELGPWVRTYDELFGEPAAAGTAP